MVLAFETREKKENFETKKFRLMLVLKLVTFGYFWVVGRDFEF